MLKWKNFKMDTVEATDEDLVDALSGMSGRNRVIKHLLFDQNADVYVRVYKDANQIVDLESTMNGTTFRIIPMDLPLVEGEICKIGYYNKTGTCTTPDIAIGYEEAG